MTCIQGPDYYLETDQGSFQRKLRMRIIFSPLLILFLSAGPALALAVDSGSPDDQMRTADTGTFTKILAWRTASYLVRVDVKGDSDYRLALWSGGDGQRAVPDMVITGGTVNVDGSGGNYYYQFTAAGVTYRCHVVMLGTAESPPGYLIMLNAQKEILREPVLEVLSSID